DAEDHAEEDGQAGADERDEERYLRAVEHAREDIATDRVDAEPVIAARPRREPEVVERRGLLNVRRRRADDLRDRGREDRAQDQHRDETQRDEGDLVPTEPSPEELHW